MMTSRLPPDSPSISTGVPSSTLSWGGDAEAGDDDDEIADRSDTGWDTFGADPKTFN